MIRRLKSGRDFWTSIRRCAFILGFCASGHCALAQSPSDAEHCSGPNLIWRDGHCMVTGIPRLDVAPLARDGLGRAPAPQVPAVPQAPVAVPAGTPQAILRARAHLDEVSGLPPEEQARVACRRLLAETYGAFDGMLTTSFRSGQSLAVPPFFPRRDGHSYVQVKDVVETQTSPQVLSTAKWAEGLEFKGSVSFRGSAFRTGSDEAGWTQWQDIASRGTQHQQFAICYYEIRRGVAAISAIDEIARLNFYQLSKPAAIPPG